MSEDGHVEHAQSSRYLKPRLTTNDISEVRNSHPERVQKQSASTARGFHLVACRDTEKGSMLTWGKLNTAGPSIIMSTTCCHECRCHGADPAPGHVLEAQRNGLPFPP